MNQNTPTNNISSKNNVRGSDEILLSDIFAALMRQKKIIVVISVLGFLLALSIEMMMPKKYSYLASVEMAKYEVNGKIKPIESLDSLNRNISNLYMPLLLGKYNLEHQNDNRQWQVSVDHVDKKNNIVTIFGVGSSDEKQFYLSVLKSLISEIKKGQRERFRVINKENEASIKEQEAKLGFLRDEEKLLKIQKYILKQESAYISDEIKKSSDDLKVINNKVKNSKNIENKSEYGLLVFLKYQDEVRNVRKRMNYYINRLNVDIPREEISIARKKHENIKKQFEVQNKLNATKESYINFQEARVLIKPEQSKNYIGLPGKRIFLSVFVLSFVLALFVAVIIDRRKSRIE